jgi:oligoendopeptidase F
MRLVLLICTVIACWAGTEPASAQAFDPFGGEDKERYTFDLARNFYSAADAPREHTQVLADLQRFERVVRGARGALALQRVLLLQDAIMRRLGKYYAYLTLTGLMDTSDGSGRRLLSSIDSAAQGPFRLLGERIAALAAATLDSLDRTPYAFSVKQVVRAARPAGSAVTGVVDRLDPHITTWGPQLFRTTLASINFGTVPAPEGELDVRRQPNAWRNHPDRQVRRAGYEANQRGVMSQRETFAMILSRTAAGRNELARARGFADYPAQSYAERFLSTRQVIQMLRAIADSGAVNRDLEKQRIRRIQKVFGFERVHHWDLTAPEPGAITPRFTVAQARVIILKAVEPLGPEYQLEMQKLLDPNNGRLDLVPRAGRVEQPGFSTGSVGYPSVFYVGRYEGYIEDVLIFAHEAGHAVQNMLMNRAGVLPRYAGGPSYFTESFALFSELLLLDYLARAARTNADRVFYTQRLLDQVSGLFRNAWESAVEQAVYDSAAVGRLLDANGVETLTQTTAAPYSVWYGPGSERELAWTQPIQLYTRPLYRVNYVYAGLLALAYFDMMQKDPATFTRRYEKLLSGGYDAEPNLLLRRTLNLEIDATELVARASQVIRSWTAAYARLD